MTPFFDTYISNTNFDEINSYQNHNLVINKTDTEIIIYFKYTYSVNVWIYKHKNDFYLCINHKILENKFGENNLLNYNNYWNKLIITKYNYEFIEDNIDAIDVQLNTTEAGIIINNWINKYKNIINKIDTNNLLCEVSAGLDTRALSYFWRNNNQKYNVYTKDDDLELKESLDVINLLPFNHIYIGKREKLPSNVYKLNGTSPNVENKYNIYKDTISNSKYSNKVKHIICNIVPFCDKEYMKLSPIYDGIKLKYFITYLLTKNSELNKLPYITLKHKIYDKTKYFNNAILISNSQKKFTYNDELISKCEELINIWNITL